MALVSVVNVNLIFMLQKIKRGKNAFKKHALASKRIRNFVALVLAVLLMGVLGLFPSNSLDILSPLNGLVMWFALACVAFCIVNLFNKETVPGKKEFSNFAYINLLFTLGMGVGIMVYGFNEAAQLSQYKEVHNPIGLTINHWIQCCPKRFIGTMNMRLLSITTPSKFF